MTSPSAFPQPICEQIWGMKYKLQTPNPDIKNDTCVEDTWRRIADACAFTSNRDKNLAMEYRSQFYDALRDFNWLPAGRITAGAGTGRNVTLFNCYVMNKIPDDLEAIFDNLKEAALTMQQGGGIGYDFSTLRPTGSPVGGVDADASGPLTFMDVWDTMCKTIMSAGNRRGAMMATMRCDHPDIEAFIDAKYDSARLRNFNISIQVTDLFMQAVENDWDWPLVHHHPPEDTSLGQMQPGGNVVFGAVFKTDDPYIYRVVKARDLWKKIMKATYDMAEPGVLFVDRINTDNNLWFIEDITATNPCGEQPLPPYGACLLGSVNLAKMVLDPFTQGRLDRKKLEQTVRTAVRMLDSVIDASLFPLEEQRQEALYKRRMGIGITGLADMLFMMKMAYGSDEAVKFTEGVLQLMAETAYRESIDLAKKFGPCPAMANKKARKKFIKSGFMQRMPKDIRDDVLEYGIRNSHLLSIAPTGTISLYAGNVSSGIEPIFAPSYTRKVTLPDGTKVEEEVVDYAVLNFREWEESSGDTGKQYWDAYMRTAQDLSPNDHLVMQAAAQKWVDSSISKTINCPEDISFEAFVDIYQDAWRMGCKGCTTYRPNDITGSVLSVESDNAKEPADQEFVIPNDAPIDRPTAMDGWTKKVRWQGDAFYMTVNHYVLEDGRCIPFEVFINTKNPEHSAWMDALTRMVSAIFRRGGNVAFVVEELKNVFDPKGGAFVGGSYVPSLIALLGLTLEQRMTEIGYLQGKEFVEPEAEEIATPYEAAVQTAPMQCPSCKGFNVNKLGGCPTCGDCGWSKCG